MAKDKKVEQITDMEVDFAQWFTDVCKKAQLIDYSSIKGVFIYRPYGYAIWENIQRIMDAEFKKQGVENVYMPMLIPESLLQKEKDHVEGFTHVRDLPQELVLLGKYKNVGETALANLFDRLKVMGMSVRV